jgi:hypothetical protein
MAITYKILITKIITAVTGLPVNKANIAKIVPKNAISESIMQPLG